MIRLLFNAAAFIPTRVGIYRESRNFSAVIPTNLHPVIPTNLHPVIPTSLHPVIPTNLHPVIPTNLHPVIPTKVGIQNAKSQETVLPDKFPHRQT
ncbi:hypothetical protein NM2001072_1999 [Neisseria meningitidis 2001072]|nr:hypothetical protein NM2001072_1999 [Neisseria meningitidis 2001072]